MSIPNPLGRTKQNLRGQVIDLEVKDYIARDVLAKKHSGAYWERRYNLPTNRAQDWAKQLEKRGHMLPQGGQSFIPAEGYAELDNMVKDSDYNIETKAFNQKIDEIVKENARNKLGKDLSHDYQYSRRSRKRVDSILDLTNRNAERQTQARAAAVSDIRNLASFAAATHYMHSIAPTNLFVNSDATTLTVGGDLVKKVRVKALKSQNTSVNPCKVLMPQAGNLTSAFIKYYAIITGEGLLATPIFIIADPNMNKDDFDVYTADHLGVGVGFGHSAEIVFTHDRNLNEEFYKWMITSVVGVWVDDIKMDEGMSMETSAWYTLDGEARQIKGFEDPEIQSYLKANNIVVGKPPGSTTAITQPLDAYNFFKGIKTSLKHQKDHVINMKVRKEIEDIFVQHQMEYGNGLKPGQKELYVQGLLDIQRAMNNVVNPELIVKSFKASGLIDPTTGGYDLEKIIKNYKIKITPEEQLEIVQKIPHLAKILGETGELTDADLDRAGFEKSSTKDGKDITRRRYVTITHPNIRQELRKKAIGRENRGEKRSSSVATASSSSSSSSAQASRGSKRTKR